jgi:hypothetical protein
MYRFCQRLDRDYLGPAMANRIEAHVVRAIQSLNYDFTQFTLLGFIDHLIHVRARDIILRPYPFDRGLHGLWIPALTADYVFYNQTSHEVHKVHNILHEIGHIILDHKCYDLARVLPPDLVARLGLGMSTHIHGQFRLVEPTYSGDELEAEVFVRQLQTKIIFANRTEQLVRRTSSIEELDRFARNLGYYD